MRGGSVRVCFGEKKVRERTNGKGKEKKKGEEKEKREKRKEKKRKEYFSILQNISSERERGTREKSFCEGFFLGFLLCPKRPLNNFLGV